MSKTSPKEAVCVKFMTSFKIVEYCGLKCEPNVWVYKLLILPSMSSSVPGSQYTSQCKT